MPFRSRTNSGLTSYVVEPWVYYHADHSEREQKVGEHLTVLTDASIDSIQRACSTGEYTHVHILAHRIPYRAMTDATVGPFTPHTTRRKRTSWMDRDLQRRCGLTPIARMITSLVRRL